MGLSVIEIHGILLTHDEITFDCVLSELVSPRRCVALPQRMLS